MNNSKQIKLSFFLVFFLIILSGCSMFKKEAKTNEEIVKVKKQQQPINMKDRVLERDAPGLFSSVTKKGGTTYDFATSNILWRATLNSLDFVPLQSANYSGGILVTDWYSKDLDSNESIKIEVRFLSNEIAASSFKINSYKKTCKDLNCKIAKLPDTFNQNIKSSILQKVKELKIEEELKKNKKK